MKPNNKVAIITASSREELHIIMKQRAAARRLATAQRTSAQLLVGDKDTGKNSLSIYIYILLFKNLLHTYRDNHQQGGPSHNREHKNGSATVG